MRQRAGKGTLDTIGTNSALTAGMEQRGWHRVRVPVGLRPFGQDWDSGKNAVLAEFQFSHYSFLWNNVIRTEAVYKQQIKLQGMKQIAAFVMVMRGSSLPGANSSLHFDQARKQLEAAAAFDAVTVPIRIVGLRIPSDTTEVEAEWTVYEGRTMRDGVTQTRKMRVTWSKSGVASFERR